MSQNILAQTEGKKAVLIVLISLAQEAEDKTKEELEAEIRKALEGALAKIPWVALKNIIIVEE